MSTKSTSPSSGLWTPWIASCLLSGAKHLGELIGLGIRRACAAFATCGTGGEGPVRARPRLSGLPIAAMANRAG